MHKISSLLLAVVTLITLEAFSTFGSSETFPRMGSGERSAVGGPFYHKAGLKRLFPGYHEGKWFISDLLRDWSMAVTKDQQSSYVSMKRFLPDEHFNSPITRQFGAGGDLYQLEYGSSWFRGSGKARPVRMEYNESYHKPVVQITADKTSGAVPFQVNLSSKGTIDFDGVDLQYPWEVKACNGISRTSAEANPRLKQPGVHTARLTAADSKGASHRQTLGLRTGNESPVVSLSITRGNKTFFFSGQTIEYAVDVTDREDGSLMDGRISPSQVAVTMQYVPEGVDKVGLAAGFQDADATAMLASTARQLMAGSDCQACHSVENRSVGPAYKEIAAKYKDDRSALERLAKKVITGGKGVWGESSMSPHPSFSITDATQIVTYILSLSAEKATVQMLPVRGRYTMNIPAGEKASGAFLLRAAYTDKGASPIPARRSECRVWLRSPTVAPETADELNHTELITAQGNAFYVVGSGAYLGYHDIDLSGINQIDFSVQVSPRFDATGGAIEVRLDSPSGKLLGETSFIDVQDPTQPSGSVAGQITRPASVNLRMAGAEGVHKLYFVFKNANAHDKQILMRVNAIQFIPGDA